MNSEFKPTKELIKSARTLVKEISESGITCDTMASERLYTFYKNCQHSDNESVALLGRIIELMDNKGAGRYKSVVYSLLAIGDIIGANQVDDIISTNNEISDEPIAIKQEISDESSNEVDYEIGYQPIKITPIPKPQLAIKFIGNYSEVINFIGYKLCNIINNEVHIVKNNECIASAKIGDWIVSNESKTEFTVYTQEEFEKLFKYF